MKSVIIEGSDGTLEIENDKRVNLKSWKFILKERKEDFGEDFIDLEIFNFGDVIFRGTCYYQYSSNSFIGTGCPTLNQRCDII